MKYGTTEAFDAEYKHLSKPHRHLFKDAVHKMIEASRREPHRIPHWPASLRVKPVQGTAGIYEMTWSFTGPDGRATFEIVDADGEPLLLWRRIGGHEIFREP